MKISIHSDKLFQLGHVLWPRFYQAIPMFDGFIKFQIVSQKTVHLGYEIHFSELEIDGVYYTSQAEAISAANVVLWGGRGGSNIPFPGDLYPIPSNKAVCGINNSGGRANIFDETGFAEDIVGKQTREIVPDWIIENDGVGGGVILDSTFNITKWAVGFRINDFDINHAVSQFTLGQNSKNGAILANKDGYVSFREQDTGTYHNFNSAFPINGDAFLYSDGSGVIKLLVNGGDEETITVINPELNVEKLIAGYAVNVDLSTKGSHYDYRIYDFSTLTPEQINAWAVDACKFHVDNMPQPDFPYHKWNMNEKGGAAVLDSGTATPLIHGILFYDDTNAPSEAPRNVTVTPEWLRNAANKVGFNKVAWFNKGNLYDTGVNNYNYDTLIIKTFFIKTHEGGSYGLMGHTTGSDNINNGWGLFYHNRDGLNRIWFDITTEDGRFSPPQDRAEIGTIYEIIYVLDTVAKTIFHYINGVRSGDFIYTGTINKTPDKALHIGSTSNSRADDQIQFGITVSTSTTVPTNYTEALEASKLGDILNEPLNGTTNVDATNIDFNKIIIPNRAGSNVDIFGREPLYKDAVKLNAKVSGGVVMSVDGTVYISLGPITNGNVDRIIVEGAVGDLIENYDTIYCFGIDADNRGGIDYNTSNSILEIFSRSTPIGNRTKQYPLAINESFKVEVLKEGNDARVFVNNNDLGLLGIDMFNILNNSLSNYIGNLATDGINPASYHWKGLISKIKIGDIYDFNFNGHTIDSVSGINFIPIGDPTFKAVLETTQPTIDSVSETVIKRELSADKPRTFEAAEGTPIINGDIIEFNNENAFANDLNYWKAEHVYKVLVKITAYNGTGDILLPYDGTKGQVESGDSLVQSSIGTYTYFYKPGTATMGVYSKVNHTATVEVISIQEVYSPALYIIGPKFLDKDVTYGNDLVPNGNMESDADWVGYNAPTTFEQSSNYAHTGNFSWHVAHNADNAGMSSKVFGSLNEGVNVIQKVYVYPLIGTHFIVSLREGGSTKESKPFDLLLNQWNELVFEYAVPPGITNANVTVYCKDIDSDFYADDYSFVELYSPNLPTDILLTGEGFKNLPNTFIDMDAYEWDTYYKKLANTVVDNSFDDPAQWTAVSNWVIANGKATYTYAAGTMVPLSSNTPNPAIVGKWYEINLVGAVNVQASYGGLVVDTAMGKIIGEASTVDDLVIAPYDDLIDAELTAILIREVVWYVDYPNRTSLGNLADEIVNGGGSVALDIFEVIPSGYHIGNNGTTYQGFQSISAIDPMPLPNEIWKLEFDWEVISGTFDNSDFIGLASAAVGSFDTPSKITLYEGTGHYSKTFIIETENAQKIASQFDNTFEANLTNLKLYKIDTPNEIGHLPSNFFNKLNVVGNTEGRPEYWLNDDAIPENVYLMPEFSDDYFRDNIPCVHSRKFYYFEKDGGVPKLAFYPNQLTVDQHVDLLNKGWHPHYHVCEPLEEYPNWELVGATPPSPTLYETATRALSNTRPLPADDDYPFINVGAGIVEDCAMSMVMGYEGNTNKFATYMACKIIDHLNFCGVTSYNNKIMGYERVNGTWRALNLEAPVAGTLGKRIRIKFVGQDVSIYIADPGAPMEDGLIGTKHSNLPVQAYSGLFVREHPPAAGVMFTDWTLETNVNVTDNNHNNVRDNNGNNVTTKLR